jgi:uncharacterized protein YjdB
MANHATKRRGKRSEEGPMVVPPRSKRRLEEDLTLEVLPQDESLPVGETLQFTATESDTDGSRNVSEDVFWKSSDPTVATIDGSGWATGVGEGTIQITATTTSGLSNTADLTVSDATQATLASIAITSPSPYLTVGQPVQFAATGTYSDGSTQDITASASWTSLSPAVASITASGVANGVATGAATITATSGGVTGSVTVAVLPALVSIAVTAANPSLAVGQTLQLTAMGTYSDGSSRSLTSTATWSSSNLAAATVAAGVASGVAVGPATITAAANGMTGSVSLNVIPAAAGLVSIAVTPSNPSLKAGQTQQLMAVGTYSDGTSNNLTATATWASSATAVATVNAGLATGVVQGTTTITASAAGLTGSTTLSVAAPVVVASIAITAPQPYVGAGQTLQPIVTATYSDGSQQDVTSNAAWSWSSPAAGAVTITSSGLVTGVSCGPINITATYMGASTNAPLVVNVVPNFPDLGAADTQAFMNAKSRVNQLLTAFERRGNLYDTEIAQLKDGLELVTEFLNNNPSAPVPNFNAASKQGSNQTDLQQLGITFNTDRTSGPLIGTGSGKANVIDDRFRAIGDYLYGPPPLTVKGASLEHDPGTFPFANGPDPGGLTDDQMRIAAIYGYVQNTLAAPPTYRTDPTLVTSDDKSRRALFNQTVETADADYRTNGALYAAALARLIQTSQTAQINVTDWAKVVGVLESQGISANNPQLSTWIDRALATAQNVGQDAPPSQINIDLPDLEQDVSNFEIISGNIFALQPAYFAAMLEELKVFQVVEKLVELFQNGVLPVVRGDAGNLLFAYWKNAALRVSETERRGFYARTLGFPGGDADSPNREFKDLFMRFVSAVSSFVRQNTVDNLLRSNIPGAISQQQVRKSGRDLGTNISSHGYGMAYPMATELQKEINDVMAILKNGEIQDAYGAKDMWQLVDQVAGLELGGAKNSVKYRTMASAGATVFAWLANKAPQLASGSYVPILDVAQLQNAPTYSTKPTTNPSDYDLVGACDQWLAVTGTDEESVDKMAQPIEGPAMPSRPIQIPSVARDMLESVGVPAMAFAGGNGKASGAHANWRLK